MEEVSNNNIISFKSRKKVFLRWHKSDLFLQLFAPLAPGRHWRARRAAAVTKNEMHTIINLDRSIILISFVYEYYKIIYELGYKYYLHCKFKPFERSLLRYILYRMHCIACVARNPCCKHGMLVSKWRENPKISCG